MNIIEIQYSPSGWRHKVIQGDITPYSEDTMYETWDEAFFALHRLYKEKKALWVRSSIAAKLNIERICKREPSFPEYLMTDPSLKIVTAGDWITLREIK